MKERHLWQPAGGRDERQILLLIEHSSYFDAEWYTQRYPDVAIAGMGAAEHYLHVGAELLRDPGPNFSTSHYLKDNSDVASAGLNPLVHYIQYGHREGRRVTAAGDVDREVVQDPDVAMTKEIDAREQMNPRAWLLGRMTRRRQEPESRPHPVRRSRVDLLLESGIFDAEFYATSVGIEFASVEDAARHCVRTGLQRSYSPSPLLDIASLPSDVQRLWREGRVAALLDYLRSERARSIPPSPLFDVARAPGSDEEKRVHPGGALGLFLHASDEHALLPVPDGYWSTAPSLGDARRALTERLRETEAQRRAGLGGVSSHWDVEAELRWVQQWEGMPLPSAHSPLVSVIIPVRNRPELIAQAIESVQQQSLQSWELLVVDDGSTDETPDVVTQMAADDARIKLLRGDHAGVSAARNRGLAAAQGEYLAFLDSDNTWRPDFLRLAVLAMHHEDLHVAYAAARLVRDSGNTVVYRAFEGGLDSLLVKNHIDLNTLVTRTGLARQVGGFDERLRRWVDHDFAIRLAKHCPPALMPFIACDYDDDNTAGDRITTTEHESWQFVALGKNWVDWARVRSDVQHRDPSLVSVVVPTYQDWRMTVAAVKAVLTDADHSGLQVEVVIVDNGSHREVGTQLVAAFLSESRVHYLRLPRNLNFAIGCNVGFSHSRGSRIVFLNNDTVVRPGWLSAMLPRLGDPEVRGVQPLLLYPDDTIQTAGTIFAEDGYMPTHFLVGHPPEDAERSSSRPFSAVTAAALLMGAEEIAALEGFDPIFVNGMEDVDLCLRAVQTFGGGFVVEPSARVTHLESKTPGRGAMISPNRKRFIERWAGRFPATDLDRYAELGLEVPHLISDGGVVPSARPLVVRPRPDFDAQTPRLRWGIKLPSIPGPAGDAWGDTHFAASLGRALERLGQEVVTYRHGAHDSSASHLDDVVLAIRGLDVIRPQPAKFNILWVISHPDDVDPEELMGFDLVYAASETWSRHMAELTDRQVLPLHQAVDIENLPPEDVPAGAGEKPVFVGKAHYRRTRQAVLDAVAADVGLVIHGPGWEDTPAAGSVVSEYVPNSELPTLYREHGLVLADHWPDMAERGFVANRVFDAVASGARVISDEVPGIEELFGGAVRVFHSVDHLRYLCSKEGRMEFPAPEQLRDLSRAVARDHSFAHRAEVLLDAALSGLRTRAVAPRSGS